MFIKRRKPHAARLKSARREAESVEDLVSTIAADKSLARFQSRPEGTPAPREVFLEVAGVLGSDLEAEGWRYAKSGPRASRRRGNIKLQIVFGSSHLNVAGELVTMQISLLAHDPLAAQWRGEQGLPTSGSGTVSARHLGHLLDPPRWLDWNLADESWRGETLNDIRNTLWRVGLPYLAEVASVLDALEASVSDLFRLLEPEAAVELLIRRGDTDAATRSIEQLLATSHQRSRDHFLKTFAMYKSEGISESAARRVQVGAWNALPFLAARFELPVDTYRIAMT